MSYEGKNLETIALHTGWRNDENTGSVAVPIHQTTSYQFNDTAHAASLFGLQEFGNIYTRIMNPTCDVLEQRMAALDGGVAGLAVASGQTASAYSIQNVARAGDNIVSSAHLYGGTYNQFKNNLREMGIEVRFVDPTDPNNFESATDDKTRAYFAETLPNPKLQVFPIAEVADIGRKHGIPLIVDNTAAPVLCRPFDHGAAVTTYSTTKYIGGHGNALGGMVTDTGNYDWKTFDNIIEIYRSEKPELWGITQIKKKGLRDMGSSLGPEAAHHLAVGSETLSMRMERSSSNALELARFCSKHKNVKATYYPGLPGHPQHARAKDLFKNFGAIFSIDLTDGIDCFKVLDRMEHIVSSSNLGDTRTLAIPVAHTIYFEMGTGRKSSMGISDSMIRFSVGIEELEDLVSDLKTALS